MGWEIKTRQDTLSRLPRQEAVYSRVFDRVWLVAGDNDDWTGRARLLPSRAFRESRLGGSLALPGNLQRLDNPPN